MFEKNPEEFALKYLMSQKPPRIPQAQAMAAGASFDAHVKSKLHKLLCGPDPAYELDTLFEAQVEIQNRDFAKVAGEHALDCYIKCGAFDDIYNLMQQSEEEPRFEFTVVKTIDGVPLLGKPDMKIKIGSSIIGDWKVKGYCSKSAPSPAKGYRLCRDCNYPKPTKSHNTPHKEYKPVMNGQVEVSQNYLEWSDKKYADQMALYGWLMGEPVGDENTMFFMEELVCKNIGDYDPPLLRVAHHRARVSHVYQTELLERYKSCWNSIQTGHVFKDMSRDENDERCSILDEASKQMTDDWFTAVTRTTTY